MSDDSLREALEKLIQEWRYTGEDLKPWQEGGGPDQSEAAMDDCANELKRVLAACSAKPVPDRQPSDAAVEAAHTKYYEGAYEFLQSASRIAMRAALEAAYRVDAPWLMPTREQVRKILDDLTQLRDPQDDVDEYTDRIMALMNGDPDA